MNLSDAAAMSLGVVIVLVPGAAVVIVALLRGYTIQLNARRPHRRRVDDEGDPP